MSAVATRTRRRKAPRVAPFSGSTVQSYVPNSGSWRLTHCKERGTIEGPVMTEYGIVSVFNQTEEPGFTMLEFIWSGFQYRVDFHKSYSRASLVRIARWFARHVSTHTSTIMERLP